MLHTGIDKHKDNSFLTTVNDRGIVVKQERLKNTVGAFTQYFQSLGDEPQQAVSELIASYPLRDVHL